MPIYKLCPLLQRTITLHNKTKGYRTVPIGYNNIADNDVTLTEFLPCIENNCMMYDQITRQCLYTKKQL